MRRGGSGIPTESASPGRREWPWTAGLAAFLFAVYGAGACRTVYVGDSGELVTAVYLLGIPHPSGYPLYVMLGKLWTLLVPAGSIAFRMSLFSSACAAAACALLFRLARGIGLTRSASLLAALLLAFGPSFWSQANIQRVYSLNAVFVLLATLLVWRWSRLGEDRSLVLAFFTCALGASNHLFMAVYAACLALFVLATRPSTLRKGRVMALSAAVALAGLIPYLYLPLRSRWNPRLDWGNPETLEALGTVVFRESFWERAWLESPADLLVVAWNYLGSFGPELLWAGTALAVAGILLGWRRCGSFLLLPLLVMSANLLSLALHGSRADIFIWHRYYIPSYIMAALLAGLGADALMRRMPSRVRPVLLIVPIALLVTGWAPSDRSRYRVADAFSRTLLGSLPPGAHLIATDDNILFASMYLHLVEGVRPDINLILQGVGGIDLPPLRFDPDRDPLFFTHHPNWNLPKLEIVPVGLAFRAWRSGRPWPEPELPPERLEGELDPRVPKDHLTQNLIGQFHYMRGVTFERRDWPGAREEFDRARAAAPDNDVLFYNLGLIHRRNGLLDEAIRDFRRSQAINPRHLASHSRPRASDRVAEMVAEKRRIDALEAELARDPALRGLPAGTPAYHVAMAGLLGERGEAAAARGHMLRAVELSERGSATSQPPP